MLRPRKRIQKRYLLMIEVLVALALLALCLIPIISPQIGIIKSQKAFTRNMELDHLVHLLYVDVLEKLHTNQISWREIENGYHLPINQELLPNSYQGSYRFEIVKQKKDKAEEWVVNRVRVAFTLSQQDKTPIRFPYIFTLVKHNRSQQALEEEEKEGKETSDANVKSDQGESDED